MKLNYIIALVAFVFTFSSCQQKTSENKANETEQHEHNHDHDHGHDHNHDHGHDHDHGTTTTDKEADKKDTCSHCGMRNEDFKKWNAYIQDGTESYTFCCTRCMIASKLENKDKLSAEAEYQVTDYYTLKIINADAGFYIMGSDVAGPMGKDFIVVDSKKAAEDFIKDHGGEKPVKFKDISMAMLMKAVK
ncbi:nitrous oxide reductase accessory protein NosL [Sediminitomix flava]|uniref:Nitrous oxide reductase accessory protein NosL n=1 Tax=Sediminitomix flava TaxID=379075 RepID=A0A315Z0U7_SEDFL|nr:nitrous oxide reductase accessory protein NosL [Sediminitomix flava]PWJ36044.1 nitrous oxide reductase accessory protein NosL [Sediminitomix flava]